MAKVYISAKLRLPEEWKNLRTGKTIYKFGSKIITDENLIKEIREKMEKVAQNVLPEDLSNIHNAIILKPVEINFHIRDYSYIEYSYDESEIDEVMKKYNFRKMEYYSSALGITDLPDDNIVIRVEYNDETQILDLIEELSKIPEEKIEELIRNRKKKDLFRYSYHYSYEDYFQQRRTRTHTPISNYTDYDVPDYSVYNNDIAGVNDKVSNNVEHIKIPESIVFVDSKLIVINNGNKANNIMVICDLTRAEYNKKTFKTDKKVIEVLIDTDEIANYFIAYNYSKYNSVDNLYIVAGALPKCLYDYSHAKIHKDLENNKMYAFTCNGLMDALRKRDRYEKIFRHIINDIEKNRPIGSMITNANIHFVFLYPDHLIIDGDIYYENSFVKIEARYLMDYFEDIIIEIMEKKKINVEISLTMAIVQKISQGEFTVSISEAGEL